MILLKTGRNLQVSNSRCKGFEKIAQKFQSGRTWSRYFIWFFYVGLDSARPRRTGALSKIILWALFLVALEIDYHRRFS